MSLHNVCDTFKWQEVGDNLYLGGVLLYNVEEQELEQRLLARGQTTGRDDENIESIKKRFVTFASETLPVCNPTTPNYQ